MLSQPLHIHLFSLHVVVLSNSSLWMGTLHTATPGPREHPWVAMVLADASLDKQVSPPPTAPPC